MKVVITGGAGFLGKKLARRILQQGSLADQDGKQQKVSELLLFDVAKASGPGLDDPRVRAMAGDIADKATVQSIVQGDVAGERLDPRIVEARANRRGDVEQQQLADFLLPARGVRQRALLQDAPRQLFAEEAPAAGDHHLHVRFRPMLCMAGSVHRSPAAVYVGAACG